MEIFGKSAAGFLIALILILSLGKEERSIGLLLTIAVCCMAGITVLQLMEPVLDFLQALQHLIHTESSILTIVFKLVGISTISELVAMICSDAGCSSLGKGLQMLASAVLLYLSIPVFEMMIGLIREIMGGL